MNSVTFRTELFVAIILGAGLNIWYPALRGKMNLELTSMGFLTYFPALVAPAVIVFIAEKHQYRRYFGLAMTALFLLLFLFASEMAPEWQLPTSVLGSFLSIFFWWVSVGDDSRYDDVNAQDASGGPVDKPLLKTEESGWKK